jgi:hypothetical protein
MEPTSSGNTTVEGLQAALVAEQFSHAVDLLRSEQKLINSRLDRLEVDSGDHEQRLRAATDGVTQFKVWSGLAAGGSSIVALIALIRAFFGG